MALRSTLLKRVGMQLLKEFSPKIPAFSLAVGLLICVASVGSQSNVVATAYAPDIVKNEVAADKGRYLKSLEDLVNIESGSRDLEGLAKAAAWVSQRLQSAGMSVETLPMKAPANHILLKGAIRSGSVCLNSNP
jgi:glutamate carboxypeptidase